MASPHNPPFQRANLNPRQSLRQNLSDKLEWQVLDMLARERGLLLARLTPSSRLLEDLGMNGDDAVDFFSEIQTKFGTDLTPLQANWSNHFGPEGLSCWFGLIVIPAAFAAGLIVAAIGWPKWTGFAIALAIVAIVIWLLRKLPTKKAGEPITVADLVASVKAGVWVK